MSLIKELKRRNVIKVAIAYAITAWLLIQLATILTDILSLPDWAPRFVAVLIIIGFPLALIFTWAFELTPDGIKLDKDVRESDSIRKFTGRRLDFFIIGILVLAVAYLLIEDYIEPVPEAEDATALVKEEPEAATNSIAVLPFVNMSADPNNEYFAEGISEEILNLLYQIPDLKVIGRTSSFSFRGQNVDLPTIGQRLGVNAVIEGSVRKSGDQVRITAHLVDVSDASRLWSQTYNRTMTDVFEIQDEVAAAIIDALHIHVGSAPTRGNPTDNTEAFALFLRARVATNNVEWAVAEELLKDAVRLDPNFAEAWELLAYVYWMVPEGATLLEAQRLLGETAARAIAINPDLLLAQTYYAVAAPGPYMRFRTLDGFERAARKWPDDLFIMEGLIFLLTEFGYMREALELSRRYVELDPLSPLANMHLPITLYAAGRTEEAFAALEFENQSDWDPQFYKWTILGLNLMDNQETAIARVEDYLQRQGYPNPGRFRDLVINGQDPATGQAYLDRHIPEFVAAMAEVDGHAWQRGLNSLYLYLGHIERYFELVLASNISATTWDDAGAHLWRAAIIHASGSTANSGYLELAEQTGVFDLWDRRGPPDFCQKSDGEWVCE